MAEHANPFGYLFIEPFLNPHGRDRIPTCELNDRYGANLPVPHSDSHGYDGRLNNVQAGKHRAHDLCIVRMVPTSTVPFLPEIFAESLLQAAISRSASAFVRISYADVMSVEATLWSRARYTGIHTAPHTTKIASDMPI